MTSLPERLAAYALLSPEERADVDREAADHPDLAQTLAEAQALATLLDTAALPPADDLEAAVADEALGDERGAEAVRRILADAPERAPEAERLRAHARHLLGGEDAGAHLERLMHATSETPAVAVPSARPAELAPDRRLAPDRAPAASRRSPGPLRRRVLVALAAALVAFGGLRVASDSTVSDRDRLADLSEVAAYEPLVTRSASPDPLELRLDAALDGVAGARRSVLGFFPRYDVASLDAAAAELAGIAAAAPPASTVSQEARLALARVRLYESRDAEAARLLAALVRDGGYRAPEARRLLDFLRTQTPEAAAAEAPAAEPG